ncbi:MAG TPA: T9SS type A sorting domain-containing protein, partial [Flavobacteriales bacterium]|nr:T9SS type A sorting domain-containing protein [Flavobacteriales bacterium]
DPAKVNPGACCCGNPDLDSDGDTYMDCLDGCPSDPNKIGPGTCGCGVPEIDTDGDGLKDCVDQCPLVVGQPGSPCDDGDPSTENDVLNLSCACTGTPAEQPTTLELTTDNDGSATSWEIVPLGGGPAVCSGSGYPSNSTQTIPCALPDGCWSLRVHDAAMDGMCCMNGIGGYVLRAPNGGRIIDAEDAGIFGATAMENLGFCLPMGNDQLTPSRCDREDYMPSDFIQAVPNPAVQAQYGVGSQTDDGYQFWFFKPNGGYSRRVFITHANSSYIFPSGPDRCSYFRLNSLSTFPLPLNTLLNVRVRSVVNGVYSDFGPACRLKIDTETNCPTTLLVATPGPNMSCGLTGVLLNGSTTLHAVPVSGATRYLFEFSKPGYVRNITSSTSSLVITKWSTWPLEYGNTYNVRVKVSFDNGASYCLFGSSCTMSTASGPQGMAQEPETRGMVEPQASSVLNFWPNPNVTGQLTIELSDVGNGAHTGQVEIISMLGTTVQSEGLNFDGDKLNTVLQLDRRVAPGSYLVRVIVDHRNWTERLVIQ